MKKSFAMKWAKALESGKYGQTKGRLFNGKNYCCLGVACILAGKKFEKIEGTYCCEGDNFNLPISVMKQIEIRTSNGMFEQSVGKYESLSNLNDNRKKFKTIAKVIRKYHKEL